VVPRETARAGATPTLPRTRKKKQTAKKPTDGASPFVASGRRPSAAAPARAPAQGLLARRAILASYPGKLARAALDDGRPPRLLRLTRVLAVRALRASKSPAGGRRALFPTFAPRSGGRADARAVPRNGTPAAGPQSVAEFGRVDVASHRLIRGVGRAPVGARLLGPDPLAQGGALERQIFARHAGERAEHRPCRHGERVARLACGIHPAKVTGQAGRYRRRLRRAQPRKCAGRGCSRTARRRRPRRRPSVSSRRRSSCFTRT
jgi:hypothetical protein